MSPDLEFLKVKKILHKNIYNADIFRKKSRAPLKSFKKFIVRIDGEIKISPDNAARPDKYSFVQMVTQ